jgi:Protein of unknown function (DUF998)
VAPSTESGRSSDLGRIVDVAAAAIGSAIIAVALAMIWAARLSVPRELYVSELGALGEPTAASFQVALVLVAVGGALVAWSARRIRSAPRLLAAWTPSVSLWVACAFFLAASQVTCTSGCPLPVGDTFTWRDFTHTTLAVIAFAAACWAMLQTAFAKHHRLMNLLSLTAGLAVIVLASVGGILSLLAVGTVFGSKLELAATTVALSWLLLFGTVVALEAAGVRINRRMPVQASLTRPVDPA